MASKLTSALLTLTFLGVGSLVYFVYKYKNKNEGGKLVKSSNKTSTEILIPKDSIGIIIGRGGNTIKEIELTANVKIHIKESDESNDNFKVCKIEGTPEGVELAEFFIHEVIVNQPLIETYEMVVPSQTCGRIIGKNGSNIRLISRSSNAKIIISSPDSLKPSLDTKIIITGTAEQIEIAKVLVEQKIEEDTQFRKKVATGVSNRAPRNKPKYLLPAKNDMEEVNSAQQKEKFIITSTNNFFEVYVSSVENPDRLWVQMIGSSTVELDRLIEQMTEYYSKIENKKQHKLSEVSVFLIYTYVFYFVCMYYYDGLYLLYLKPSNNLYNCRIFLLTFFILKTDFEVNCWTSIIPKSGFYNCFSASGIIRVWCTIG